MKSKQNNNRNIQPAVKACCSNIVSGRIVWDRWGARRTLYHKSSLRWAESLGAAKAAYWFLHADIDVSPPHDSGALNRLRKKTGI